MSRRRRESRRDQMQPPSALAAHQFGCLIRCPVDHHHAQYGRSYTGMVPGFSDGAAGVEYGGVPADSGGGCIEGGGERAWGMGAVYRGGGCGAAFLTALSRLTVVSKAQAPTMRHPDA